MKMEMIWFAAMTTAVSGKGGGNDPTGNCYRDSYSIAGDVIGIAQHCHPPMEKDGGLCYPPCREGYKGIGSVCWEYCPDGWRDDGAVCNNRGGWAESADNSECPWWDICGLVGAKGCSKCPDGTRNDGCTCWHTMEVRAKHSYIRGGEQVLQCEPGQIKEGGLCYPPCHDRDNKEYEFIGTVCWEKCGGGTPWDCGAVCTKHEAACAEFVTKAVFGGIGFAASVATIPFTGGASALKIAGSAVKAASKAKKMGSSLVLPFCGLMDLVFYDWGQCQGNPLRSIDNMEQMKCYKTCQLMGKDNCFFASWNKITMGCDLYLDCDIDMESNDDMMSAEAKREAWITFAHFEFPEHDTGCWTPDANVEQQDARCAGDLVCARTGFDGRNFGGCKSDGVAGPDYNQHCCSEIPARYTNNEKRDKYVYVGCFRDDGARDFAYGPVIGSYVWGCFQECHRLGYDYFSLQNGGECFCDDSYSTPADKYPEIDEQHCGQEGLGGGFANSVYMINHVRFIGCYKDDSDRDLCCGPQTGGFTANSCAKACLSDGFTIFGLQNHGECFCDNDFSTPASVYPEVDESLCGDKGLGGGWTNAIYEVLDDDIDVMAFQFSTDRRLSVDETDELSNKIRGELQTELGEGFTVSTSAHEDLRRRLSEVGTESVDVDMDASSSVYRLETVIVPKMDPETRIRVATEVFRRIKQKLEALNVTVLPVNVLAAITSRFEKLSEDEKEKIYFNLLGMSANFEILDVVFADGGHQSGVNDYCNDFPLVGGYSVISIEGTSKVVLKGKVKGDSLDEINCACAKRCASKDGAFAWSVGNASIKKGARCSCFVGEGADGNVMRKALTWKQASRGLGAGYGLFEGSMHMRELSRSGDFSQP